MIWWFLLILPLWLSYWGYIWWTSGWDSGETFVFTTFQHSSLLRQFWLGYKFALDFGFGVSNSRIIKTWLKESDHLCDIPGCNFIYEHNINSYWGRCWFIFECGFWVKMPPQIRLWQQYSKRVICWISLTKEERYNRRRDLYTTHTHLREFCDELVGLVLCLSKCNKLCILLEDWNLDIKKHEQHRLTEIFGCNVLKNVFPPIYAP